MAVRAAQRKTRNFLVPLLLAVTAASFAAPALADDDDDGDRGWNGRHGYYDRGHDRDDRRWDRDDRKRYDRYQRERWQREQARRYEQQRRWDYQRQRDYYRHSYYQPRPVVVVPRGPRYGYGYGRGPAWAIGRNYRSYGYNNVYYVPYNDYGRYDLYEPGYGRRWVRDDAGNFLLVAAATGIIASILTR